MRRLFIVFTIILMSLFFMNLAFPKNSNHQDIFPQVFTFKMQDSQLNPIQLLGKKLFIDRNLLVNWYIGNRETRLHG